MSELKPREHCPLIPGRGVGIYPARFVFTIIFCYHKKLYIHAQRLKMYRKTYILEKFTGQKNTIVIDLGGKGGGGFLTDIVHDKEILFFKVFNILKF